MRSIRHWTPRYVLDRLTLMAYERRYPQSPWLTQAMVQILDSWLRPGDRGLEWGSGRSTLWFARRVSHLISVEHDETWYRTITRQLQAQHNTNVDYRFCQDNDEYLGVTADIEPASLDFALVDGQVRDACALRAISCLRSGGILVVDNSNWYLPSNSHAPNSRRPHQAAASATWEAFWAEVRGWRSIRTTNGVTDTTLWVKPG